MEEKKTKRLASFYKGEAKSKSLEFPHLSSTFRLAGFINSNLAQEEREKIMVYMGKAIGGLIISVIDDEEYGTKKMLRSFP